ncbi:MAG: hypothetical protein IKG42_06875 [Clostridia bacterium]|nr:hypothetical protein [Clostridia bacterium]
MGKKYFCLITIAIIVSFLLFVYTLIFKYYWITLISVIYFIFSIIILRNMYELNVLNNRRYKQLTVEEQEIVDDAKELIKSIDENIIISDFNVYKTNRLLTSWTGKFFYDTETNELCIFIPFSFLLRFFGKKTCFVVLLHELLHSQNCKNNIVIFKDSFNEGLTQFLTLWLIDNYSEKYKIPKEKAISISVNSKIQLIIKLLPLARRAYPQEVGIVERVIKSSKLDLKEIFINYIDMNPEFFKSFVPEEYLIDD